MKTKAHGTGSAMLAFGFAFVLAGCTAAEPMPAPATVPDAVPAGSSTPIDGTYSVTWTYDDLYEALGGAGNPDASHDAQNNAGELRLTFDAGDYDLDYVDLGDSCPGTFVVEADRVVMTATEDPSEWDCGDGLGQLLADAAWALDDETLSLTDWHLSPQPAMDWFAHVMLGTKPLARVK